MAMARGDFLMFLDGDDWCEPHTVERMLAAATRHDSDVVIAGTCVDHEDGEGLLLARELHLPPAEVIEPAGRRRQRSRAAPLVSWAMRGTSCSGGPCS